MTPTVCHLVGSGRLWRTWWSPKDRRRQGGRVKSLLPTTRLKEAYRDHLLPYEQHLTKDARFTEVPVKYGPILALNPEEGPSSLVGAGGEVSG